MRVCNFVYFCGMETIFDHNVTDKELKRFGGREAFEKAKRYGVDLLGDKDTNFYQIGILYASRGDRKKANKYWSKIKDKRMLTTLVQDF